MKVSLFYLPSLGSQGRHRGRHGRRCAADLYQQMLREVSEQARLADELGYDSISFTEHHFHVEGFELSNNPVLLDLYIAMQTKRIRVGQLGIVLPAANPIRVAEDIAMLDHMTGGRANAGFARGYQRRWVDVMAQQTHGIHGALPHQHDAIDAANRDAFEECFRIIKKAWTEDMLVLPGQVLEDPAGRDALAARDHGQMGQGRRERHREGGGRGAQAPAEAAPADLPAVRLLGALDPLVRRRRASPPSCRRCTESSSSTCSRSTPRPPAASSARAWACCATSSSPTPTRRRASCGSISATFAGNAWFVPFGFRRGMLDPETGEAPTAEEAIAKGYALVGTVDTVTRSLEALKRKLPVDWLFAWTHNTLVPHAKLMRSIELFSTKVLPQVG